MSKRYYITTPSYYVNSVPHVGTTLTTVVCDITARYQKMRGMDVMFLTGTDENGAKVAEAAEAKGEKPQEFVDRISGEFQNVFRSMGIDYDDFLRTTEPRHVRAVQRFFEILKEKGHIYMDKYEGWYDVSSETFVKESDLVDGKSPDGNEVRWVEEENWFFRLSAFSEPLLAHIQANPDFLLPESRKNEVLSFIGQGLRDICVTRANQGWGIAVPGDPSKIVYVWFDALINYLSATGWPDNPDWSNTFPADVHLMAKEIFTRFHATLWPAMLMAADLPLPKHVVAHGWFTFGEDKMSKSKGNVIPPLPLVQEMVDKTGCRHDIAVDAVRYSLAVLLPYEGDTNYTREEVDRHYNADLANDLGNALNRSLSMAHKFVGGKIPNGAIDDEARAAIESAKAGFESAMTIFKINAAVDSAWTLVRFLNKYIDTKAPWALAKNSDPALDSVMRSMLLCLRAAEGMVHPIIPNAAGEIARQLGLTPIEHWSDIGTDASLPAGTALTQPEPIFPRIDPKLNEAQKMEKQEAAEPKPKPAKTPFVPPAEIDIKEFMNVQLRVARILEAEPVEGSEKLVKLQVMVGDEKRQILAGIRKSYEPLDLVGRQVIVVANLKPAKLMGHESQGMILAADGPDGTAILLQPEAEAPEGTSVH